MKKTALSLILMLGLAQAGPIEEQFNGINKNIQNTELKIEAKLDLLIMELIKEERRLEKERLEREKTKQELIDSTEEAYNKAKNWLKDRKTELFEKEQN